MPNHISARIWVRLASVAICLTAMGYAQQASSLANTGEQPGQPLTPLERQLLDRIEKLEQRIAVLEAKSATQVAPPSAPAPAVAAQAAPVQNPAPASTPSESGLPGILAGTTFNGYLDTYYAWNFNNPVARVNLLRAYDVLSNAFSLNQADLVIENAPDLEKGKRWGVRLDFQYGQATETLQGNAANEL
ncbi:MAG: outer membrane beta-barrel protein, partial [Bryobacteraceae bacterium]